MTFAVRLIEDAVAMLEEIRDRRGGSSSRPREIDEPCVGNAPARVDAELLQPVEAGGGEGCAGSRVAGVSLGLLEDARAPRQDGEGLRTFRAEGKRQSDSVFTPGRGGAAGPSPG